MELYWRQITSEDVNPLEIALPLLDSTSVGLAHRRPEFDELRERIAHGLNMAVNEHFQAFNDSVGSYRLVVEALSNSQKTISNIKETVLNVDDELSESSNKLNSMNENLNTYNQMIEILENIEYIKKIPIELETLMNNKNYSKAESLINDCIKRGDKFRLWELPAMKNLEHYFETQREQLFEILIEELFQIVFSKREFSSFNSISDKLLFKNDEIENNFTKSYSSNIEIFIKNSIDIDILETASLNHLNVENFIKNLTKKSSNLKEDKLNGDGNNNNILDEINNEDDEFLDNLSDQLNPFNQIYSILTIISKLDKLPTLTEIIIQRSSMELNQLINRIVEDTKLKYPKLIKFLNNLPQDSNDLIIHKLKIEQSLSTNNSNIVILQDLFWNFFRKLLFFIQSSKITMEIIKKFDPQDITAGNKNVNASTGGITNGKRHTNGEFDDDKNTLSIEKLWNLVQSEIREFVLTYISNDDNSLKLGPKLTKSISTVGTKDGNTTSALTSNSSSSNTNNNNGGSNGNNDKLFKFDKVIYDEEKHDNLKVILKDLFPGFISSNELDKISSPYIEDVKFLKKTKLIPSNIFNMRIILEPFLLFIQGSILILSNDNFDEIPIKFFDSFMKKEFLPILEETFLIFYQEEIDDLNSFEVFEKNELDFNDKFGLISLNNDYINNISNIDENNNTIGEKPQIFKFVLIFKRFFSDICFILNTSLQFRKEFSSIIFNLINKFEEKIEEIELELINEFSNYLEPNKEIIKMLSNLKLVDSVDFNSIRIININKQDLKNLNLIRNIKNLNLSLNFLINWFDNDLIKKIDLNKTDLNLTKIEKLRKNWSFFEIINLKTSDLNLNLNSSNINPNSSASTNNNNKIILDDELTKEFQKIVANFKNLQKQSENALKVYNKLVAP